MVEGGRDTNKGRNKRTKAQGRAAETENKSRVGGGRVTGDVEKGQRGSDRSIKEMNGSVRIKGNAESVIIRRQSRWRRRRGHASHFVMGGGGITHMQVFKVVQV